MRTGLCPWKGRAILRILPPLSNGGREEKSKLPRFGIKSNRHIGWDESVVRLYEFPVRAKNDSCFVVTGLQPIGTAAGIDVSKRQNRLKRCNVIRYRGFRSH
jgi:hypothetical protein